MWPAYNSNDQQQFDFLDMITVYSAILQTLDYTETMNQSSNDDIIKEMHRQNAVYFKQIIAQNQEILEKLDTVLTERKIFNEQNKKFPLR